MAAPPTLPLTHASAVLSPAGGFRALRLWHLTSLDAPTVAVAWCLAFAWAARVQLPIWLPAVLALAAWSFYIADRLLDARKAFAMVPGRSGNGSADRNSVASDLRPRHHFHWRYRRVFVPAAAVAALVAVALALHSMPQAARVRNSLLTAAAMAYFATVHSPWRVRWRRLSLPKELLVGILFTLACATPAWARMTAHREALAAPVLVFIGLAWLNCHAIECWESRPGLRHRLPILPSAGLLVAAALAFAAAAAALHQPRPAWLLTAGACSGGLLGVLDRFRLRVHPTTLRAAADLVLLAPLVLLLAP